MRPLDLTWEHLKLLSIKDYLVKGAEITQLQVQESLLKVDSNQGESKIKLKIRPNTFKAMVT